MSTQTKTVISIAATINAPLEKVCKYFIVTVVKNKTDATFANAMKKVA